MTDTPYTQRRPVQFRGPTSSTDYNLLVEERYRDLVALFNKYHALSESTAALDRRSFKELMTLARALTDLEERVTALEANDSSFVPMSTWTEDWTELFQGTEFEVAYVDRCYGASGYGFVALPAVSFNGSALAFISEGDVVIPDSLGMRVVGEPDTADSIDAVIDTTGPETAVARFVGHLWERNVIVDGPDVDGAQLTLYIKVPPDVSPSPNLNYLIVHPFPVFAVEILEVATTTSADVIMDDGDNYEPINSRGLYEGDDRAIGWVPPGGWTGDTDERAGIRCYYFPPAPVTGFRIKIKTTDYYQEAGRYVYTYGMNRLDAGYLKFLDSGRIMVQYNADDGETISEVTDVQPDIFNVIEAEIPDVFSYRVIWETAVDSGIYTESPVPFSEKVWIEVTLNRASDGTVPQLSGITVTAS